MPQSWDTILSTIPVGLCVVSSPLCRKPHFATIYLPRECARTEAVDRRQVPACHIAQNHLPWAVNPGCVSNGDPRVCLIRVWHTDLRISGSSGGLDVSMLTQRDERGAQCGARLVEAESGRTLLSEEFGSETITVPNHTHRLLFSPDTVMCTGLLQNGWSRRRQDRQRKTRATA